MSLDTLPNEILTHIFNTLPALDSVLGLASTCSHLYRLYHGSQRLAILASVLDTQYGPLHDLLQICTHNASQPAHLPHTNVPLSDALIQQILDVGRVAAQWEEIYPLKKWKNDYASRRLLTTRERFVMRRAMYRLWLYDRAFHTRHYTRTTRNLPHVLAERALLLHNFRTPELAEMLDVHHVLRDVVANNVCPSNGKIRQKFHKRFPESAHGPMFNIHLNYPTPHAAASWCDTSPWTRSSVLASGKYSHARLQTSRFHEPGMEGWGDDINHYYVVEDMLKLDPQQILFLRDRCPLKAQVEMWVKVQVEGGEMWFVNNGETFAETLWSVIRQRGGEVEEFKAAVEDGEMGVAVVHG